MVLSGIGILRPVFRVKAHGACRAVRPGGRKRLAATAMTGILLAIVLASAGPAPAATVNVNPGTDTIANALATAQDGDVLLLADGTYDGAALTISNAVTIRAASKAATPALTMQVIPDDLGKDVVLQGLQFRNTVSPRGRLKILECSFVDAIVSDPSGTSQQLILIGNDFQHSGNMLMSAEASELIVIAGNRFVTGGGGRLAFAPFGTGRLYLIGNEFEGSLSFGNEFFTSRMVGGQIIGNRFVGRVDSGVGTSVDIVLKMLEVRGSGQNRVLNNLFQLTDTSAIADTGNRVTGINAIDVAVSAAGTEIRNNVFDYGGAVFDATNSADEGVIDLDETAVMEGNIFLNANRPNVTARASTEPNNVFAHNLCHMTVASCGTTDGNQDADPLFVDLMDYRLGMDSPGIDAGPDDAFLVDLDGTRADLGLYAGPFPIDQYDAQRDDTTSAPFIYPLFDASRNVDVLGDLQLNVIGVARLR